MIEALSGDPAARLTGMETAMRGGGAATADALGTIGARPDGREAGARELAEAIAEMKTQSAEGMGQIQAKMEDALEAIRKRGKGR